MSKQPTSQAPADNSTGKGDQASTPAVPGGSVDTENPNDAIEAYHERLRKELHED